MSSHDKSLPPTEVLPIFHRGEPTAGYPRESQYATAVLLIRLPHPPRSHVDVQANLIDRVLLGGTTLGDMHTPGMPYLQLRTTDLRAGSAVV